MLPVLPHVLHRVRLRRAFVVAPAEERVMGVADDERVRSVGPPKPPPVCDPEAGVFRVGAGQRVAAALAVQFRAVGSGARDFPTAGAGGAESRLEDVAAVAAAAVAVPE